MFAKSTEMFEMCKNAVNILSNKQISFHNHDINVSFSQKFSTTDEVNTNELSSLRSRLV